MRFLAVISLLLALIAPAARAQTADDDRGTIQAFLERNLSGAGRDIRLNGFAGALSSRVTIEEITIADSDGIWLVIRGAVLDWTRSAVLRGAIEIDELAADQIVLTRLPVAQPGLPAAEATPFSLPELPVSVAIGRISAPDIEIGAAVLGQLAHFSVEGSLSLSGGDGTASLALERRNGPTGSLSFDAGYSNQTGQLDLSLHALEAGDGVVSSLLALPDRPDIALDLTGAGPLTKFAAELNLSTDGAPRVAGTLTIDASAEAGDRDFSLRIGGDLRPLMQPQSRAFFGRQSQISAAGRIGGDGAVSLAGLAISADGIHLDGSADIAADGWPERVRLTGRMAPAGGSGVLTLPGGQSALGRADLSLDYDAAQGDAWRLSVDAGQVTTPGFAAETLRLTADGSLSRTRKSVDGNVDFRAEGVAASDPALRDALGDRIAGTMGFDWQKDAPLALRDLTISGAGYDLTGDVTVTTAAALDLDVSGTVALSATDLGRYSALAGRRLAGGADLRLSGSLAPVSGAFDVKLAGRTNGLALGMAGLDGLLAGETRISLDAARGGTGIELRQLQMTNAQASLSGQGRIASQNSKGSFAAVLVDAATLAPGVSGRAELTGTLSQAGANLLISADGTLPGAAETHANAVLTLTDAGTLAGLAAEGTLSADDISPFAGLAGRDIGGGLDVSARGRYDWSDGTFAVTADATANGLRIGSDAVDPLLAGDSTVQLRLRREDPRYAVVDALKVTTPQIYADLTGRLASDDSRLRFTVDLRDIGLYATGFSGPLSANGVAANQGADWSVEAGLTGPGGTTAKLAGTVAADGATANVDLTGQGPLALANRFIQPRILRGPLSFDLHLDGPPELASVSGRLAASGADLGLPDEGLSLTGIDATADLSGGIAEVAASGRGSSGGQLRVAGRITLSDPFAARLDTVLRNLGYVRENLIQTTLDGEVIVAGPLFGGATLGGRLDVGQSEIRIPETSGLDTASLPALRHVGELAAVRASRGRAGLVEVEAATADGPVYGLDLTIVAPNRLFVRGRGLDAELGGTLVLGGTTAAPVAKGRLNLIRGRFDILGKRLDLTEGWAELQGRFDPYLHIVARTQTDGVTVAFQIEGPASAPVITLTSSPDLPQDEILSRLLFGHDLSQISPLQAIRLAAAVNTLSGRGGPGAVNRIRQAVGVDDLDIATDDAGNAGLRVGKYLGEKLYTDVTVNSGGESEINLNLSLSPSVTAKGSYSSSGNTGVGVFFERDY